tara:strand:+ start:174 stop:737 length:564 start_codon:yes stop_codon:yes gene_type:complete
MGFIGWIAAAAYLFLSLQALYALKGIVWVLVSLAGPIAIFPLWAAVILGYNDPIIWGLFIICVIDAIFTKNKMEKRQAAEEKKLENEELKKSVKELQKINQLNDLKEKEKEKEKEKDKKEELTIKESDGKLFAEAKHLQALSKRVEELEGILADRKKALKEIDEEEKAKKELREKISKLEKESWNYD